MIGAYRGDDGLWYDTLGERQYFFLWDTRNRQPQPELNERLIAIYAYSELAIERGQE